MIRYPKVGMRVRFMNNGYRYSSMPESGTLGTISDMQGVDLRDPDLQDLRVVVDWDGWEVSSVYGEGRTAVKIKFLSRYQRSIKAMEDAEIQYFVCPNCGVAHENEDEIHGEVCEDCASCCDDCGAWGAELEEVHYRSNSGRISHKYVCTDCFEGHYLRCDNCGESYNTDTLHETHSGRMICDSCLNSYYGTCYSCGEIFPEDDLESYNDENYCPSCYPKFRIMGYHSHPDLVFHRDHTDFSQLQGVIRNFREKFFMGMELEVSHGSNDDNEVAEKLYNALGDDRVYFNYDGSVHGFECITHPAHYGQFMSWDWDSFFNILKENRMGNAGCGLHIHVSKNSLGRDNDEIDANIMKILYFMEKYWDAVFKFSRRDDSGIRWAKRYDFDAERENLADLKRKVENGRYDRYHCVNLTNSNTIEFRIFNGTVKIKEMFSAIEFVHLLCLNVLTMDVSTIQDKRFKDFFNGASDDFWKYCDDNEVKQSQNEDFEDIMREQAYDKLVLKRISGQMYIVVNESNPRFKMTTRAFTDKYGIDLILLVLKNNFNIECQDFKFRFEDTFTFHPIIFPINEITRSFDGKEYVATNYRPDALNEDGTITVNNVRWNEGHLIATIIKTGRRTYLRKFQETKVFAELFGVIITR